jgi:hypothetical protein
MKASCKWLLPPLLVLLAIAQSPAAEPGSYDDLLQWIPEQANTLLLMDIYELHKSPLGKQEEWAKKHTRTSLGGMSSMNPKMTKVVVAAQLNPSTLHYTWEAGIFQLDQAVKEKELSRLVSGTMDSVAGKPIVLSPRNAYFVQFKQWVIGMMKPANRQAMAQWVRFARPTGRVVLTPYLTQAQGIASIEPRPQIVAAVDLSDVMDPQGLRNRLKKAKALAGQDIDIEEVTKLFTGLKGVTLVVRVVDTIQGELHVDFTDRPDVIKSVAKRLLLDAVDSAGMAIEDLDNWAAKVEGKSIVLSGPLTERGTRMMLSPLLHPTTTASIENEQVGSSGSKSSESAAAASQRYFSSVKTMLDDLQQQKVKTYKQQSYWYHQFAEKIDELPMLNVDEDLLKFGSSVSTTLRGMCNLSTNVDVAQEGIRMNMGETLVSVPSSSYYYGNGYGWGYGYGTPGYTTSVNNYGMASNMIAKSAGAANAIVAKTWQNIEQASNQIRQQMTQKYQVEFK